MAEKTARNRSKSLPFTLALLRALLLLPARVATARRLQRQMAGMSEGDLRDIGLTRQDVWDASTLPLGADPGRLFQARVDERIGARRARHVVAAAPPTMPDLPEAPLRKASGRDRRRRDEPSLTLP